MSDWFYTHKTILTEEVLGDALVAAPSSVQLRILTLLAQDWDSLGWEMNQTTPYDDRDLADTLEHHAVLYIISTVESALSNAVAALKQYNFLSDTVEQIRTECDCGGDCMHRTNDTKGA